MIPSLQAQEIIPGAERISLYINKLIDKKVAVIANNTSIIKNGDQSVHLIDTEARLAEVQFQLID